MFAATFIAIQEYAALGYAGEFGAEEKITQIAHHHNIPIFGLETAAHQFSALLSGTFEEGVMALSLTLSDMPHVQSIISAYTDAWISGDTPKLQKLLHDDMARVPNIEENLIHGRNRNWAVQLDHLMKESGYFFVAVGAGHLVGNEGVPELMKKAGHSVTKN